MAKQLLNSSIMRKVAMGLSGFFLITFLMLHVSLNLTSVISEDLFNRVSHFMGYNPLVQYIGQPILIFGLLFHFIMGFILEIQNRRARPIRYAKNASSANSSWPSRNMIISGLVILSYFCLHWYDFWFQELNYKFIEMNVPNETRYYGELIHKFQNPVRTFLYCGAFVLLGLHLWHGFYSSMQSVGLNNKYARALARFGKYFAVVVPACFIFIALFHHFIR
ncbi:succinate dehydrogenase cytochrome b subunit [Chryseobacterium tongliaoense]|uniref:succinate dehydrogenase cytochrome b subunit n=1 Tax=Chryseobacterium tongliaoense TaxID=3240933 RepID=UPI003512872A